MSEVLCTRRQPGLKELVAMCVGIVNAECQKGSLIRGFIDNSVAWSCLAVHKSNRHRLKLKLSPSGSIMHEKLILNGATNISCNELMKVLADYLRANDLALEIVLVSSSQNFAADGLHLGLPPLAYQQVTYLVISLCWNGLNCNKISCLGRG